MVVWPKHGRQKTKVKPKNVKSRDARSTMQFHDVCAMTQQQYFSNRMYQQTLAFASFIFRNLMWEEQLQPI
jgi:hypothetical protein